MTDWARMEIAAACKRENPNWDGESFDYGCSCYQSALKAYESLMNDGHSGYSFSVTRNILEKLLHQIPLSPITDEDFDNADECSWTDKYKQKQCPRRSSLFREEYPDGTIKYHDNDRSYCINAENTSDTYSCSLSKLVDEMFPITMPYTPLKEAYKIYVVTWLTDKANGDFDTKWVKGIETPDGKYIVMNKFYYKGKEVTNKAYIEELLNARLDKRENKTAASIINNIIYMYIDHVCRESNEKYRKLQKFCDEYFNNEIWDKLSKLCEVFFSQEKNGVYYLNNWHNHHIITGNSPEDRISLATEFNDDKDRCTLLELFDYVDELKEDLKAQIDKYIENI